MNMQRYSRQILFSQIDVIGQEKLLESKVAIVGVGALGTVIANNLCRAGVGYIRLIDRDYIELSNLHRQTLFTEEDARQRVPKAIAAYTHLAKVNSDVTIEPLITDVNSSNIEEIINNVDMVIDGSDNFEVRFLMNEACVKAQIPWIYGGALMSTGMTMNIFPGQDPCFRCIYSHPPPIGSSLTCSNVGVINMITGIIACIESSEAVKILIGSEDVRKNLIVIDIWNNSTEYIEVDKDPNCPVCMGHQYEYLEKVIGTYTTSLCGSDAIQVIPRAQPIIDFEQLADKLMKGGVRILKKSPFMLSFTNGEMECNLFSDGRALIKNAVSHAAAMSIYSEYIGL